MEGEEGKEEGEGEGNLAYTTFRTLRRHWTVYYKITSSRNFVYVFAIQKQDEPHTLFRRTTLPRRKPAERIITKPPDYVGRRCWSYGNLL